MQYDVFIVNIAIGVSEKNQECFSEKNWYIDPNNANTYNQGDKGASRIGGTVIFLAYLRV